MYLQVAVIGVICFWMCQGRIIRNCFDIPPTKLYNATDLYRMPCVYGGK